jgi:hypothetical protein
VCHVIDGRYQINNNGAGNGVRSLAAGRKNCLFCGNHEAAGRTTIIYSLPGICKINWLTDVLNRINDCEINALSNLLPDRWVKSKEG